MMKQSTEEVNMDWKIMKKKGNGKYGTDDRIEKKDVTADVIYIGKEMKM